MEKRIENCTNQRAANSKANFSKSKIERSAESCCVSSDSIERFLRGGMLSFSSSCVASNTEESGTNTAVPKWKQDLALKANSNRGQWIFS